MTYAPPTQVHRHNPLQFNRCALALSALGLISLMGFSPLAQAQLQLGFSSSLQAKASTVEGALSAPVVSDACADPGKFNAVEPNLAPLPDAAPNAAQCNLPGITPLTVQPVGTRLVVEFDRDTLPADGQSAAVVTIKLLDAQGQLVTGNAASQQVTLEVDRGRWNVEDADPNEPGVQVKLVNGQAQVKLIAHHTAGDATVRFSAGNLAVAGTVAYTPDLRPMLAAGMVEGIVYFNKRHQGLFAPVRANDAFEKELRAFSRESTSGDTTKYGAARASLFLKGTIKGEYLLTIGADSDKDTRTKLYRDIKPDAVYPVYGDSSIRGWEAETKGKDRRAMLAEWLVSPENPLTARVTVNRAWAAAIARNVARTSSRVTPGASSVTPSAATPTSSRPRASRTTSGTRRSGTTARTRSTRSRRRSVASRATRSRCAS